MNRKRQPDLYITHIKRWDTMLYPADFEKAVRLVNRYAISLMENMEPVAFFDIAANYILIRPVYASKHGEPLYIRMKAEGFKMPGDTYYFHTACAKCEVYDQHIKAALMLVEHCCDGFDVEKDTDPDQWLEARTQVQLRLGLSLFRDRPNPPTWLTPLQVEDLRSFRAGDPDPVLDEIDQLQEQGSE